MKINLGTKSCLNQCKVDTGVDDNLLLISVYKCPGGNVFELAKSVGKPVAYNNTKIKQCGVCHIMVQFKVKHLEAEFFAVDQTTTLTGFSDSVRLGLIMVNCFDSLNSVSNDENEVDKYDNNDYFTGNTDMKCQDKLASDHFKTVILNEYKKLFSGICKLDGEINITLKGQCSAICCTSMKGSTFPSRTIKMS